MGGRKVLLQSEDLDKISKFIEEEEVWWSKWFSRIKLWSPSNIADERLAWIRITGLPLQVWNQKMFERIGNKLGSFIKVDPHIADKICLDVARVLIITTEIDQIDKDIYLIIRGHSYPVKITEERWRTDPWWLKTSQVYDSDMSDSEDQVDSDSNQVPGRWSLASEDEV